MSKFTLDSIIFARSAFTVAPVWAPPLPGPGVVSGTSGDDVIDVNYTDDPEGDVIGAGDDAVLAGAGNDTVRGEAGDDEIYGGTGDDYLKGLEGDDELHGEDGDDLLVGGEGADTIYGGSGNDLIYGGNAGDVVDGGSTGSDYDTLDLTENGPLRIVGQTTDADGNSTSGTVEFLDAAGVVTGTMTFSEIENLILPVGTDPVANDDTATTDEDTVVTIDVLGNDTDPNGDTLSIVGTPTAPNGTVTVNGDGTLEYTPDADFNGTDTITYTISDGNGGTDTAEVAVTVNPINDDPVANDDAAATPEDTLVNIDVLGNDTDVDGDTLSVVGTPTAANGTVTVLGDGTLDYTPDAGFTGVDTITYEITDGNGGTDTADVAVTVGSTPGNTAPVANDDMGHTPMDTTVTLYVLGNDEDLDGDTLTINGTPTSPDGTVTVNGDGSLEFTPNTGFEGVALIEYEITDGNGGFDTATVHVSVGDDLLDGIVEGTAAGDLIDVTYTGDPEGDMIDNEDAMLAGEAPNDDIVEAGAGDDTVISGEGSDDVYGGDGNDLIDTSNSAPANDHLTFLGVPVDADPENDRDLVEGGAGDDTITTGDDSDTIYGGTGADSIASGIDDDFVYGGEGADFIDASLGNDYVEGGTGDDTIHAGFGGVGFSDYLGDDPNLPNVALLNPDGSAALFDPNAFDGRDTILGGDGNDLITTGDDQDVIYGGADNDTIDAGIDDDLVEGGTGDDSITGGHGSDTLYGNEGDDYIDASNSTLLFGNAPDATDPVPENDRDLVEGGEGNDTILGGDDDDTLLGGLGNDVIDGGIDEDLINGGIGNDSLIGGDGDDTLLGDVGDDTIDGGADEDSIDGGDGQDVIDGGEDDDILRGREGDDTLTGGHGNDTMTGGFGDDLMMGGDDSDAYPDLLDATDPDPDNDRDLLSGRQGNDTIYGGDDDDTLLGGSGNDYLDGGIDEDSIEGGAGDDTIIGGQGADTMSGNDDQDTFSGITAGDVIDGGEGGVDFDTLDLTGSAPVGGSIHVAYDANPENGTVEFRDADGLVTDTMTFSNIENVIPCFTPGTVIATPTGERLVEELVEGDRIITRDNGIQEIRWKGAKLLTGEQLMRNAHLKPVLIQAGSLGNGLPERDMLVSPNHRILVSNDKTALYFEEREVLAAAKHLTGMKGVDTVDTSGTTYIHFMFDQHEVVLSNGAWTESFQPGDQTLKGLDNAQRSEIFELFPELQNVTGIEAYQSARRSLKKHEAKLLAK